MSTPSERLEAEIWLETRGPEHLSDAQAAAFSAAVDEYYAAHPTAERGPDFLATLREDDSAFTRILEQVLTDASQDAESSRF